jgi:hypothetical protein
MGKLWGHIVALLGVLSLIGGCGPSQAQLDQAQDQISRLQSDLDTANRRHADDEQKYAKTKNQIEELKARLLDLSKAYANERDLRERLSTCQNRPETDCRAPATIAVPDPAPEPPTAVSPAAQSVPYPGNGGGPTLCSDGSVSGSSGRGTCSHHGGVAGGRHRRH